MERNPLERMQSSSGLLKLVRGAFVIPELVMGAIFAGVPAYAFVTYWWPAFEAYRRGEFRPDQSAAVLFGFLLFGALFFFAGLFMLRSGLRTTGRLIWGDDASLRSDGAPTPEQISEARSRVLEFPRFSRIPDAAAGSATGTDVMHRFVRGLRTADGSYELRSRPVHLTFGLALAVFALIWNGILGLAASDLLGWSFAAVIFGLFLLPFFLVGFGLLGGAAYFLSLALLHPELTVRLKADRERRTLSGTWSFPEPPSRLRDLRISVRVVEKQTKGEGEHASTLSIPVLEQTLVEGASLLASHEGRFSYAWPEGLELPSAAGKRGVEWIVTFHASSPGLPAFRFWAPVVVEALQPSFRSSG